MSSIAVSSPIEPDTTINGISAHISLDFFNAAKAS